TDMAVLFHILPGYLYMPNHDDVSLDVWTSNYGTFRRTFLVNLLQAWFGEHATPEYDFAFNLLMKKNGTANHYIYRIFEAALEGMIKMLYVMGQNPAVSNPNLNQVHEALGKLETLGVADLFVPET